MSRLSQPSTAKNSFCDPDGAAIGRPRPRASCEGRGMDGKTVVVTGASSGIGLETARALAGQGARVVMVVRSKERGEAAIAEHPRGARRTRGSSSCSRICTRSPRCARPRAELRARCERLDVLVNNAGLIHERRELTPDGFERTFALNHLAPFLLTYELRELLAASAPARVVTVSSKGHRFARFDWDDLATMERWKGETGVYGASKLCNIWFAREAARRLGPRVTSNSLHPGPVAVELRRVGRLAVQVRREAREAVPALDGGGRADVDLPRELAGGRGRHRRVLHEVQGDHAVAAGARRRERPPAVGAQRAAVRRDLVVALALALAACRGGEDAPAPRARARARAARARADRRRLDDRGARLHRAGRLRRVPPRPARAVATQPAPR